MLRHHRFIPDDDGGAVNHPLDPPPCKRLELRDYTPDCGLQTPDGL